MLPTTVGSIRRGSNRQSAKDRLGPSGRKRAGNARQVTIHRPGGAAQLGRPQWLVSTCPHLLSPTPLPHRSMLRCSVLKLAKTLPGFFYLVPTRWLLPNLGHKLAMASKGKWPAPQSCGALCSNTWWSLGRRQVRRKVRGMGRTCHGQARRTHFPNRLSRRITYEV